MKSELFTKEYPNGDRQRIQQVTFDSWSELDFIHPEWNSEAFSRICSLYRDFIVPKCPWIFGQLIIFRLPDSLETDLSMHSGKYGFLADKLTASAVTLRRGVLIICGKPLFLSSAAKKLWIELESKGCLTIVQGNLPNTTVLPVTRKLGFLSESFPDSPFKVNSSFFIMDRFDCSTAYDSIGTPIGMYVKHGRILNPPLFSREALLADKYGNVKIAVPQLSSLGIKIGEKIFCHGENATFFSRPSERVTPLSGKTELVIIEDRVAAVKKGGRTSIPSSGFVIRAEDNADGILPGDTVEYIGLEDVEFGLQVGNSVIVDGRKTQNFVSPFYNIKKLWSTSYPPSLYPLDYEKARAPRIALAENDDGNPSVIWVEGAAKFGYISGDYSCGASLSEMAEICSELGIRNAVNLDGGGSAQILINNRRTLNISDRSKDSLSEIERAVPVGIICK